VKFSKNSVIICCLFVFTVTSAFVSTVRGAPVNAEYKTGLEYFNKGQIDEAVDIWQKLLYYRADELTSVQINALKQRISHGRKVKKEQNVENVPSVKRNDDYTEYVLQEFDRACRMAASKENSVRSANQFEQVVELLEKAQAKGLTIKNVFYYKAYCLVALNRLDEAPGILDSAIEEQPLSSEPLNLLADYLHKIDNLEQEIVILKKSLKLKSCQPEVEYRLIRILLATRSRKKLQEAYVVAVNAINGSEVRARNLARLFPKTSYREKLEIIATEIAIENEKAVLRKAMEATGKQYTGPGLRVVSGKSASGQKGSGSSSGNSGGQERESSVPKESSASQATKNSVVE